MKYSNPFGGNPTPILRIHCPVVVLQCVHYEKHCSNSPNGIIYVDCANEFRGQVSIVSTAPRESKGRAQIKADQHFTILSSNTLRLLYSDHTLVLKKQAA